MKKLIVSILILPAFLFIITASHAAENGARTTVLLNKTASSGSALRAENVSNLKQRGDIEIQRRIDALNKLIAKINSFKKLTDTQKSSLNTQVQAQIDSLNTLKVKIDADTDPLTLRTDVKSIVSDYRIYVFFIEDISLIAVSERLDVTLTNLTAVSQKLKTRIDQASSGGKDVTTLNNWYTDLILKLNDAKSQTAAARTEVTGLTASGYPGNKTALTDARSKLKAAYLDIRTALSDGKQIIQTVRSFGNKNENGTSSGKFNQK